MRKIILIFLLISNYSFSQTGWVVYPVGTNNRTLKDIFFINANTGWVVGDTTAVFKTTNGGINWVKQNIEHSTTVRLNSVRFLNDNTGFVAGGESTPMNGYYFSYLFKTTNGGNNWNLVNNENGNCFFNSIYLIDENNFFVSKEGGEYIFIAKGGVYKTTNGGINFDLCFTRGQSYSVYFANPSTGWGSAYYFTDVGGNKGFILKTTDAGLNWTEQHKDSLPNSTKINKIQFINENTGFAVGMGSNSTKFFKTSNGGINWSISIISGSRYQSLFFINQNTGWISGASYPDTSCIAFTSNGGANWSLQKKNYFALSYNLFFINNLTGWATLSNGGIMKTTTSGVTFVNNISSEIPSRFSLSQNYPNPFNPSTNIKFRVPYGSITNNKYVTLKVFDILGKEIATLVYEKLKPGEYGVTFDGTALPSGVYFYKLQSGDFTETKKMLLIK